MAYSGHTTIVIPKSVWPLLAGLVGEEVLVWDLGVLYKVYMGMLVVFCSNSSNILAGVNGLEAGQTAVIAASDLGVLYKVYMGMLVVFCSNSINILAGVNGLEAGQTAVIAAAVSAVLIPFPRRASKHLDVLYKVYQGEREREVLLFNIWQIGELPGFKLPLQPDMQQAHLFSIYLSLPLLACTLELLVFNWYPSSVFVGDTFTYFAGMTLAVVPPASPLTDPLTSPLISLPGTPRSIVCPKHRLPKFVYATFSLVPSLPLHPFPPHPVHPSPCPSCRPFLPSLVVPSQLFKFVPCPRHRLPK
ncbi:unnamed protein product [Closterium sp. Naga37s-1]|nr:unnamed protein product [Closterium sp. Naga37s-1]